MKNYLFTGFSPNTRQEDAWLAFTLLFSSHSNTRITDSVKKIEHWFREYFAVQQAYAVDSGRSALQLALSAGGVTSGDEVLLQAFTCVVVANSITNLGAKPVYVDCNQRYLIDPDKIEAAITPQTKAIIIQHTFGASADLEKIIPIARKHNLLIVEDCAHSLGASHNGKLLGTFGDVAIFSFGSDKVISGVRGGMVITNNPTLGAKLKALQAQLPPFPIFREFQHLFHPIYFYWGKKTYHLGIGKIKLYLAKRLHIINRIIDPLEKQGRVPTYFPALLPARLATLALNQIKNLDQWNKKRQENAAFYVEQLKNKKSIQRIGDTEMWLRFPVEVTNLAEVFAKAKAGNIMLGNWYSTPIAPADALPNKAGYQAGSCVVAEQIGMNIVNLPTDPHLTKQDLERVVEIFS